MEFKTIEEAQEYIKKIEDEKKNLSDLLENQKAVMTEKENSIDTLNQEINRLKIKNYENRILSLSRASLFFILYI